MTVQRQHDLIAIATIWIIFLSGPAVAQLSRPRDAPTREEAMQILDYGPPTVTYGGNVIFSFPNYDISIGGTPEYAGQGNGRAADPNDPTGQTRDQVSTRVIYKSPNGAWDGSNFVLSPNYNYSYANNYYRNRALRRHRITSSPDESTDSGVWRPKYLEHPRMAELEEPGNEPPFAIRTAKSLDTLDRMSRQGPSFTYSPTPSYFTSPRKSTFDRSKAAQKRGPKKSARRQEQTGKQILWELDQTGSSKQWARRQAESTSKIRRNRRGDSLKEPTSDSPPKRLSPEPHSAMP